jgi:glycerophosphoryl diester phosphodiesterase
MGDLDLEFLRAPIAHRALHDAARQRPENSLAAVHAAVAAGYGIEIDIQPSLDGIPMVFHDYFLDRLAGKAEMVREVSAAELQSLRLLDSRETIPTLADVLLAVGGRVPILIEIKDQDGGCGPNVGPLEVAVAGALRGYSGPIAVMSFNPHSVAAFHRAAPNVAVGLTTSAFLAPDFPELSQHRCDELREISDYDRVDACFISHDATDLGSPRVAALKAKGARILCWTIRSKGAEAAARRIADNITFEGYDAKSPG